MLYCNVLYYIALFCVVILCYIMLCYILYCIVLYRNMLYCIVLSCYNILCCGVPYCTVLYCIVLLCYVLLCCDVLYRTYRIKSYCILSHALKNTANQRPGLPLHILRYATGNMQRVVFHSTFPSLLARKSLLGSIWTLLKSQLRNSSINSCEPLRTISITPENFPKISEDFRKF